VQELRPTLDNWKSDAAKDDPKFRATGTGEFAYLSVSTSGGDLQGQEVVQSVAGKGGLHGLLYYPYPLMSVAITE
jgi:hypothetical protein